MTLCAPNYVEPIFECLFKGEASGKNPFIVIIGHSEGKLKPVLEEIYKVATIDKLTVAEVMDFQKRFLAGKSWDERDGEDRKVLEKLVTDRKMPATTLKLWKKATPFANSTACGAFQMIRGTIEGIFRDYNTELGKKNLPPVDTSEVRFTPEVQKWGAYRLLEEVSNKLSRFLANANISEPDEKEFIYGKLCKKWAFVGIPPGYKTNSGREAKEGESLSFYDSSTNKARIPWSDMQKALRETKRLYDADKKR